MSGFKNIVERLKHEHDLYAILVGDLCESSIKTSKGDIFKQAGSPQDQRDWVTEHLLPVKHKLLAATTGNHEERIMNEVGIDISADIAKALGIPYRATGVMLKISFGGGNERHPEKPYVYWGYATHGYGGARTKSAKAVKVERTATFVDADWYAMAHDHVTNAAPDIYLKPDPRTHVDPVSGYTIGHVQAKRKMLVKTSAYLKWGGYSERGGCQPTDLESPEIIMAGEGKPKVRVLL